MEVQCVKLLCKLLCNYKEVTLVFARPFVKAARVMMEGKEGKVGKWGFRVWKDY